MITADVDKATDVEKNKQTVLAFCKMAFGEKRPAEAAAQYLGESYTQHSPRIADGPEAFVELATHVAREYPATSQEIKRVVAEGDLVVLHSVVKLAPDQLGAATVDIFRLDEGKIVEHWDVAQRIPDSTISGNPMV